MASPYGNLSPSGSPGGSPYGNLASNQRGATKPKKKGRSVGGFLGNLWGGAEDAVVGLGPSLLKSGMALGHDTAKIANLLPGAPKRYGKGSFRSDDIAKEVGASYAHQYGPLFAGMRKGRWRPEAGKFGARFYDNPLGPILDVSAVLSLGATGAARVGLAPAAVRRGTIELRGPAGKVISKPLPRQTLRAELQVADNWALNKLPRETKVVGEHARAARLERKGPLRTARSLELLEEPFMRALVRVRSKPQRLGTYWLSQVPLPQDLGKIAAMLDGQDLPSAQATAAILRDPKFVGAFTKPNPKMLHLVEEASHVAEAQRVLLGIPDDVARRRAYLPTLIARGATIKKELSYPPEFDSPEDFLASIEKELDDLDIGYPQRHTMRSALISARGGRNEVTWKGASGEAGTVTKPRSRDDIEARIVDLETQIEAAMKPMYDIFRQHYPTRVVGKDERPRKRLSEEDKGKGKHFNVGGGEYIDRDYVPVRQRDPEQAKRHTRERAQELAYKYGKKPDAHPLAREFAEKMDELDELRDLENRNIEAGLFGDEAPGYGSVESLVPASGFSSIEEMIAKIDADLDAAGRPHPVYMPHTSEAPKFADLYGSGGKAPQRKPGPLHQTMGILLGRGQLIQDPQVLARSFRGAVKFGLYSDIHALHLEHSVPLPSGETVPKGWSVVRQTHGERTPYTVKTGADFEEFAKANLDEKTADFQFTDNPFTTKNGQLALVDEKGARRIVPTEFSRQLTGEFIKAGRFWDWMQRHPVRVWRHLVLKLRPAWLVNNILGNTLLYAIHSSDPIAIQELARTFRGLAGKNGKQVDDLMRKHFPEHVSGTFVGSQMPVYRGTQRSLMEAERLSSIVGAGLAQVDRWYEQGLRRAIIRSELRKSPELRKFSGKMRGQTDEFWKLADEKLDADPLLGERISDRVNDALGDFLALGRFERNVLRSAFPFYAWFRIISLITLKLPLTHPLKAPLLARLGEVGATSALEELGLTDEDVYNYAKGFVAFSEDDGRMRGAATTNLNPLATVAQLQDFVSALAAGKPGEAWDVLPGLNPFVGIPLETLTGAGRSKYSNNRFGIIGTSAENFARSVPQVRLGEAFAGTLYTGTPENPTMLDRDAYDELLRYLGIPYGRLAPREAINQR